MLCSLLAWALDDQESEYENARKRRRKAGFGLSASQGETSSKKHRASFASLSCLLPSTRACILQAVPAPLASNKLGPVLEDGPFGVTIWREQPRKWLMKIFQIYDCTKASTFRSRTVMSADKSSWSMLRRKYSIPIFYSATPHINPPGFAYPGLT